MVQAPRQPSAEYARFRNLSGRAYSIYLYCIMINTTDLQELEISLPGDWLRKDNGDTYSFTTDKMELRDERMFREVKVQPQGGKPVYSLRYALTIEDDYCGVMLNDDEFVVLMNL